MTSSEEVNDDEVVQTYEELVASYGKLPGGFMSLAPIIIPILKTVGYILFVTATDGVLGKVISSTSLVSFITENASTLQTIGIFFPFLLVAILKTAQGSSTVAITTTAGIMASLMGVLGMDTPAMAALCVMAIGAGAMIVSHANDSYFWVITNFGGMTLDQGYKTQTAVTLVEGICSMVGIFIISLFLLFCNG